MRRDKRSAKRLQKAVSTGDLQQLRELIAEGIDVLTPLDDGDTPIVVAGREGHSAIVRALVAAGAELSELEVLGIEERIQLMFLSRKDHLLDDDLIEADELHDWAMQSSLRVAVDYMTDDDKKQMVESEGDLLRAVRTGDMDLLKEKIAAGLPIDQAAPLTAETPLIMAIRLGHEEMVHTLIAAGADLDQPGFSTPLAVALPDMRMMKTLVEAGAEAHSRGMDVQTALERACRRVEAPRHPDDSILLVRLLLEGGALPSAADQIEGMLLREIAMGDAWELFQEILPHYPEAVAGDELEELEDSFAMRRRQGGKDNLQAELKVLASAGALDELRKRLDAHRGQDIAEPAGKALRSALEDMNVEAVRMLIDAGADLDAVGYEERRGSTPLACAAESWHRRSKDMLRLLLDAGADIDGRGHAGRTPLMYATQVAIRHGAALRKAIPVLLEAGADLSLEDKHGHTAWSLARAPLVEADERGRLSKDLPDDLVLFDSPDLSDLFSDSANAADGRQDRLERCRQILEVLEDAGAEPHRENELRLLVAATAGDVTRVGELLEAGADADARGPDGDTAIAAAARGGHREAITLLIAKDCAVDAAKPGESSALQIAVQDGDTFMVRQLLDAGANALMLATFSRHLLESAETEASAEAARLVRDAIPQETLELQRQYSAEDEAEELAWESQRALPGVAGQGDLDKVSELLAIPGVEIDAFDPLRRTALMAAAEGGHLDVVDVLLTAGAAPNACNRLGGSPRSTPLICAAICPSADRDAVLRRLLDAGADIDQVGADGRTALMHAAERDVGFFGRIGEPGLSVRTLIDAGADLDVRDPYGLTAWMRACSLMTAIPIDEVGDQYEHIAELLQAAGATTQGHFELDLVWAVLSDEIGEARSLLDAGADPNARRFDGATALMLAVRGGYRDIVQLLLDAGCDVDARQWLDRGPRAIDAAFSAHDQKTYQMLIAAGASPPEESRLGGDRPSPFPDE